MRIDRNNNIVHAEMFPESCDGAVFLGMMGGGIIMMDASIAAAIKQLTPAERDAARCNQHEATINATDLDGVVPDFDTITANNQAVRESLMARGIKLKPQNGNKT